MKWTHSLQSHPQQEVPWVLFGKNTIFSPLLAANLKFLKKNLPLWPPSCFSLVSLQHNGISQLFKVCKVGRRNIRLPTLKAVYRWEVRQADRHGWCLRCFTCSLWPGPDIQVILCLSAPSYPPSRVPDGSNHLTQEEVVASSPGFLLNNSLSNLSSAGSPCSRKKFLLRCCLLFSNWRAFGHFTFLWAAPAIVQSLSSRLWSLAVSGPPHPGYFSFIAFHQFAGNMGLWEFVITVY